MKRLKRVWIGILGAAVLILGAAALSACDQTGSDDSQPQTPATYTLTYSCGEGGLIIGEKKQEVLFGQDGGEVRVLENEGYYFIGWSDGVKTASRREKNVASDMELTALFGKNEYTVTYLAGAGGSLEGKSEQKVLYRETTEGVTAVADFGYRFIKWSDGDTLEYRRDFVKSNFTVTAEFGRLFESGTGTEQDPFVISTFEQFQNVSRYPAAHFVLANSIRADGAQFKPLFPDHSFTGTFDGKGNRIYSLAVVSSGEGCPSLFGMIGADGVVKNLDLVGFSAVITGSSDYAYYTSVGSVAAVLYGTLQNVTASGTILVNGGAGGNVGGLVGSSQGVIENCSAFVTMQISDTAHAVNAGGLVGTVSAGTVSGCRAEGRLTTYTYSKDDYLGGLAGYVLANTERGVLISDCEASVDVIARMEDSYAGGFVGFARASSYPVGGEYVAARLRIERCTASGSVVGNSAGGVAGKCESTGGTFILENCSARGAVSGYDYTAGLVAQASGHADERSQIRSCTSSGWVEGYSSAAGLVAYSYRVDYTNCSSACEVEEGASAGGLFASFSAGTASGCAFTGTVLVSRRGGTFAAIVQNSQIENCVMSGEMEITTQKKNFKSVSAGGFVGSVVDSTIRNCYCTAIVSFTADIGDYVFDWVFEGDYGLIPDESGEGLIVVSAGCGVRAFAAQVSRSDLINCHVYFSCLPAVPMTVGKISDNEDKTVDVTGYENLQDMTIPFDENDEIDMQA